MASSSNLAGRGGRAGCSVRGGRSARGIELVEIIPPPPTNQLEYQGVLARDLARVVPTTSSTTLASSSNLAGRGDRGGCYARGTELMELPPPPPRTQLEDRGDLARDLAVVAPTSSSTTFAPSN